MTTEAVAPFAALALLGLAAADERLPRLYAVVKPLATAALFLVLAPQAGGALRLGIAAGLALATCGDALLVNKADRRFFYAGMAAFALAHLAYSATLLATAGAALGAGIALVLAGALTALLQARLSPRLTSGLVLPVRLYGAILTGTVVGGSAWLASSGPLGARALVFGGALLLYGGDAFYAFNRFVRRLRFGQSTGLVLYWGGQLALVLGVRLASA